MDDENHWTEAEECVTRARRRFTEAELGLIGPMLVVPLAEARLLAHAGSPAGEGQVEAVESGL